MNERLQEALAQLIEGVLSFAQQATEVGVEVVPEVVRQLILFNGIKYATIVVLCVGWISLSLYALYKTLTAPKPTAGVSTLVWTWDYGYGRHIKSDGCGFAVAFLCVVSAFLIIPIGASVEQLLMIHFAPYVWLVEYTRGWM